MNFYLAIIGYGLTGKKRAENLGIGNLIAIYDKNKNQIKDVKKKKLYASISEIINNKKINIVIVSTPHKYLANLTIKLIRAGKHVLVEKPGGINFNELKRIEFY